LRRPELVHEPLRAAMHVRGMLRLGADAGNAEKLLQILNRLRSTGFDGLQHGIEHATFVTVCDGFVTLRSGSCVTSYGRSASDRTPVQLDSRPENTLFQQEQLLKKL